MFRREQVGTLRHAIAVRGVDGCRLLQHVRVGKRRLVARRTRGDELRCQGRCRASAFARAAQAARFEQAPARACALRCSTDFAIERTEFFGSFMVLC